MSQDANQQIEKANSNKKAWIALGANLEDPSSQCEKGLHLIKQTPHIELIKTSSFYRSEPLVPLGTDPSKIPWYINLVCEIKTQLDPLTLLNSLKQIEIDLGRKTSKKWESRLIDIDLLFYESEIIKSQSLTLPHPGIPFRRFVLAPLAEIAPQLIHPVLKKSIQELLDKVEDPLKVEKL